MPIPILAALMASGAGATAASAGGAAAAGGAGAGAAAGGSAMGGFMGLLSKLMGKAGAGSGLAGAYSPGASAAAGLPNYAAGARSLAPASSGSGGSFMDMMNSPMGEKIMGMMGDRGGGGGAGYRRSRPPLQSTNVGAGNDYTSRMMMMDDLIGMVSASRRRKRGRDSRYA